MKPDLFVLNEKYSICRFNKPCTIPVIPEDRGFFSLTVTPEEVSVVCPENEQHIFSGRVAENGWRIIKVIGPLSLTSVGIIAGISKTLADRDIPVFVISTYDTDYILVKEADLDDTVNSLETNKYHITFE